MFSRDLLAELWCPYCGGPLAVSKEVRADRAGLRDAIISCPGGEFPLIDGILWLSKRRAALSPGDPPELAAALDRLRDGDPQGALVEAMLGATRHRSRRLASALTRAGLRPPRILLTPARRFLVRHLLQDHRLTFADAVYRLRDRVYADYLFHRFANPSLLAAIPVILLLRELAHNGTPPRVIDLGGGAGHAAFLISRFFPGCEVILTDGDFANLYLAGRFLAPRAMKICLDAEAQLPFPDASADALFSMDAFHYLRSKAGVTRELQRIGRPAALWLFPHLHNALAPNPTAGYPLAPGDYRRLFPPQARLFAEGTLLRRFHDEQVIDLSSSPSDAELEHAATLTMVSGPPTLWRRHDVRELYLRVAPDLAVNRLYHPSSVPGELRARWPNAQLRAECQSSDGFLETAPHIDRALLARLSGGRLNPGDRPAVESLIRDFALVPLPPSYGERE